ncbi:hypothetical protein SAMN05216357_10437 [Porphyromonadaceae bacterium KH3CP3RA]|nr:hypothetical protein SAMN05216357_10437 [Porphyromonadaceae bacterium KH3CP3RA]
MFSLLFVYLPLLLSAQLDIKAYQLSKTTDKVTFRIEV